MEPAVITPPEVAAAPIRATVSRTIAGTRYEGIRASVRQSLEATTPAAELDAVLDQKIPDLARHSFLSTPDAEELAARSGKIGAMTVKISHLPDDRLSFSLQDGKKALVGMTREIEPDLRRQLLNTPTISPELIADNPELKKALVSPAQTSSAHGTLLKNFGETPSVGVKVEDEATRLRVRVSGPTGQELMNYAIALPNGEIKIGRNEPVRFESTQLALLLRMLGRDSLNG